MYPLLFETIRWLDGCAERLPWHQQRAEASCGAALPPLAGVLLQLGLPAQGEWRVHIPYDARGWRPEAAEAVPYVLRRIRRLQVVEAAGLSYPVKSEDRRVFDYWKQQYPEADELLFACHGYLTDTTFSNILLGEPGDWLTPSRCLLPGTRRAALLAAGQVTEAPLHVEDLGRFPYMSLINAMLPPGRLMLPLPAGSTPLPSHGLPSLHLILP